MLGVAVSRFTETDTFLEDTTLSSRGLETLDVAGKLGTHPIDQTGCCRAAVDVLYKSAVADFSEGFSRETLRAKAGGDDRYVPHSTRKRSSLVVVHSAS